VKNLLKILLELLFSFQNLKKNKILIIDTTPYSGSNGYALYKFLKKMNDCYEVELFQEDKSKRIQNYLKRTLKVKGAAVVISTHGIPCLLKRKKQLLIELWHGIPFKAMGLLEKSLDLRSKKLAISSWNRVDVIVSSSVTYSTLINACFGTYKNSYVITGFPRNDYLFDNGKLQELFLKNNKKFRGKRVILFVPTFRKGYINRVEGIERDKNVFGFEEFDMKVFDDFLGENRALLIVKLHPFEEEFYKKVYETMNLSNFYFLTSEMLESSKIDLYEILPDVDLLITDYSSIYFDFLLLNKPIIFVKPDFEQYSIIRGVLLSPYDFWTPGPKVTSQDDLEKSISEIFSGKDNYAERRKELKDIFFEHQDGNSSERILQVIKDKLGYFK